MSGLIIKDGYTMIKQTKVLLILTILFAVIPSDFMFGYSVFYAAMMPITALAYDERAKWDKFAGMLPYSAGQIVGSKFIIGYLSVGCVFLLTLISKVIFAGMRGETLTMESLASLLLIICVAVLVQAVNLPIMFWIGVEKGRMIFVLFTVLMVTASVTLLEDFNVTAFNIAPNILMIGALVIAIVGNLISFQISKIVYIKKN